MYEKWPETESNTITIERSGGWCIGLHGRGELSFQSSFSSAHSCSRSNQPQRVNILPCHGTPSCTPVQQKVLPLFGQRELNSLEFLFALDRLSHTRIPWYLFRQVKLNISRFLLHLTSKSVWGYILHPLRQFELNFFRFLFTSDHRSRYSDKLS